MADKDNINYAAFSDLLGQFSATVSTLHGDMQTMVRNQESYLHNIEQGIRNLSQSMSQSAARDVFGKNGRFGRQYDTFAGYNSTKSQRSKDGYKYEGFVDEFEKVLISAVVGKDFKSKIDGALSEFAKELKVEMIGDIPGKLGQELGKKALAGIRKNENGLGAKALNAASTEFNNIASAGKGVASQFVKWAAGSGEFSQVTAALGGLAGASSTVVMGLVGVGGLLAAVTVVKKVLQKGAEAIKKDFMPAITGVKSYIEQAKRAMGRYETSRQENLKLAQKRLIEDVNAMVREPFDILKAAAESVYDAWDRNIRLINGTQGYTKSDLQNLFGAFSARLQGEGLSAAIGTTNVIDGLATVLQSGLSGKIAEEFAYQAVKLNAAIPTQDFFGYAATYSSVAAQAQAAGKSQSEAIAEANASLYEFSNNVLYASRELSGGFTTGLRDAQSLYEQAVKIQQASKVGDVGQISGVLTAVAGIVGAVAPDLATSMTDAVYQAAVGGNSNSLVALRSLAGVNASNTEFLKQLAMNPKGVYSTIFKNLAGMFASGGNANMEKAEGYAELFGLPMEAFQRIDFNYLSKQIASMDDGSDALNQNITLLRSGQTTQTKEQQKNAQITQYMIDEGLAFVIDNDVARSIQEHMWDEQLAREMMEAEYGVELRGAAMEALNGLRTTVENILNFLNPVKWFSGVGNLLATMNESRAQQKDIKKLLEAGKVGTGRSTDLHNLTTTNANLNLTPNIVELFGAKSSYNTARNITKAWNNVLFARPTTWLSAAGSGLRGLYDNATVGGGAVTSAYSWGGVGKSSVANAGQYLQGGGHRAASSGVSSAASRSVASLKSVIDNMLRESYIKNYLDQGKGYEEWKQSAKGRVGDLSEALSSVGYSESDIRGYFQTRQAERGWEQQDEIRKHEQKFREAGIKFWDTDFWDKYNDPLTKLLEDSFSAVTKNQEELLRRFGYEDKTFQSSFDVDWMSIAFKKEFVEGSFSKQFLTDTVNPMFKDFRDYWRTYKSYYIDHKIYGMSDGKGSALATGKSSVIGQIQAKEAKGKGDVVNALSEYLTQNSWDLADFQDPQIQANAILSQILIVVNAIMNQSAEKASTVTLQDALSVLAMGGTYSST